MKKVEAYQCDYCGKVFITEEKCLKHEKICIKNLEANNCNNCLKGNKTCFSNNIYRCIDKNIVPDSRLIKKLSEKLETTFVHLKVDCPYFENKNKPKI